MDQMTQLGEQARMFLEHHVPPEVTTPLLLAVPIGFIVIGLGLAVLGAKLAKPTLAVAFGVGGVVGGGLLIGRGINVSPAIVMLLGGLVCGVAGYMLHRLWVGLGAAVLISTLAGAGYGAQSLLPALQNYHVEFPTMAAGNEERFTLPESEGRGEVFSGEFKTWVSDVGAWGEGFWRQASAGDVRLKRYLPMVAIGAGLVGLVFGLVAPRFTMISLTSVLGVGLMLSGSSALVHRFEPGVYEAAMGNPRAMGVACAAILLGSVIVQTLLTRSDKKQSKKQGKS